MTTVILISTSVDPENKNVLLPLQEVASKLPAVVVNNSIYGALSRSKQSLNMRRVHLHRKLLST